ncbi:PQQ-dependent catabolism-associated beta-propeller protein [Grimontia kaedaensis]|uniref:PQQ-dependent catabolism-associated beta-propeller protein n=1 Tax=Grimontia kaedaensis TaxID=2872157 RepID=A0ABY4WVX1_9GAMM|nr:PQQ-dependent catabolism-associated beta-propeller protein [Grimontia kaedaensis]USH02220.1 PQQ-dependent catabolism-associated beta-propeller protein [Grimontia kaedaensis]
MNYSKSILAVIFSALLSTPALAKEVAYVANEKDDTVSVIDMDTMEVIDTIEVGDRPRGVELSKDGTKLFICASESDTVQILDLATNTIVGDLPSGDDPELFALHPDGNRLYIANEDDALMTVVDIPSSSVIAQVEVGVEPEGVAVSPDGKIAIITSETSNMAHWIDTQSNQMVHNTLVDARPRYAEFTPSGEQLWVSAEIGGTVAVIDTDTKEIIKKIGFAPKGVHKDKVQPVGVKITADGKTAFVALGPANHVAVVNTETLEVEDYLLVGRRVWQMAFNGEQDKLLATNGVSGDVSIIDVPNRKVVKTVKVGRYPWGVAVGQAE